MKVLVCGGRDYTFPKEAFKHLDRLHSVYKFTEVIHGGAKGADRIAGLWAMARNIPVRVFPALWERYGKSAGAVRNVQMLTDGKADLVVAFKGGNGTAHMMRVARRKNVPVIDLSVHYGQGRDCS